MGDWFRLAQRGPDGTDDAPVRVVAYEKGGLDLVLVRAPGVGESVQALEGPAPRGPVDGRHSAKWSQHTTSQRGKRFPNKSP